MQTHVFQVGIEKKEQILNYLQEQEFEISKPPYTHFCGKKPGLSVTFFESGKCVVQGKEAKEFIEFFLEPEILETFETTHKKALIDVSARIGVDESGKGDFFGPLVIAGVYGDKGRIEKLVDLGVRDSKSLTDKAISVLAEKIKRVAEYQIVIINPLKYNELYASFKNLNALLAWGHATVIEALVAKTGCQEAIIDQFADERVVLRALERKKIALNLTQRHRGEEDPVVAAASILAREAFVARLEALSKEVGFPLPKGASPQVVAAAKKISREELPHFVKMHFKTLDKL